MIFLTGHFLRLYLRDFSALISVFAFAVLLEVVSSFSFRYIGISAESLVRLTPGVLWIVFLFSGTMILHFTADIDRRNSVLVGLQARGIDMGVVFLARLFSALLVVIVTNLLVLVSHEIFFGVPLLQNFSSLLSISFLFAIGYISQGIVLSHISARIPAREILLPLIVFPLSIPVLAAAVTLTRLVLEQGRLPLDSFWMAVLMCFAIISTAVSWLLFGEAVRN